MTSIPTLVVVVLFGTGLASQPAVVPKSVIAQVGTDARFNCTTVHNEPVYWTTTPYGSTTTDDIYIGEIFLLDDYGTSGRFSVKEDSILKRYDLVIKDIKQTDAGVYNCVDERGLGKKDHAELIVWDTLTCQTDPRQESYMGDNVFDLEQDTLIFTCKMNYKGNIRPQFVWSVGERMLNGTQGTESGIASSSLILIATSKLDGVKVTCEAVIKGSSSDDARTGILWTSDTIRVKYAVLKTEGTKECPGVENSLSCNPPCAYRLETVDGIQRCTVNYSAGADVKFIHFYQSSAHSSETGSPYPILLGVLAAVSLSAVIILGTGCLIKKLRFMSKAKNKDVENTDWRENETQLNVDQGAPVDEYILPENDDKIEDIVEKNSFSLSKSYSSLSPSSLSPSSSSPMLASLTPS